MRGRPPIHTIRSGHPHPPTAGRPALLRGATWHSPWVNGESDSRRLVLLLSSGPEGPRNEERPGTGTQRGVRSDEDPPGRASHEAWKRQPRVFHFRSSRPFVSLHDIRRFSLRRTRFSWCFLDGAHAGDGPSYFSCLKRIFSGDRILGRRLPCRSPCSTDRLRCLPIVQLVT